MDETNEVMRKAPLFEALDEEGAAELRCAITGWGMGRGKRASSRGKEGEGWKGW